MIVLHEFPLESGGLLKCPGVEAFEEEAAVIAEDFGFEEDDFGDGGGGGDHFILDTNKALRQSAICSGLGRSVWNFPADWARWIR